MCRSWMSINRSVKTMPSHRSNIMKKRSIDNTTQLAFVAVRSWLLALA